MVEIWRILVGATATLTAFARRLTCDAAEADDSVQDVILSAAQHWQLSGVPDNPGSWLRTAVRYRQIDRRRAASRCEGLPDLEEADTAVARAVGRTDAAEADLLANDLLEHLESIVAALPAEKRVLFDHLRIGLTPAEGAELLGISKSCYGVRIHRLREYLSEQLARHGAAA